MTDIRPTAIRCIQRGLAVFPTVPGAKTPATAGGCLDWTLDPRAVRGWDPAAGLAVATGDPSGLWVLDLDRDKPGRVDGAAALAEMERAHGPLPPTLQSRTPSGGIHLWFPMPAGVEIRNRTGLYLPDGRRTACDVRGTGGYVVVPPTVLEDGRRYVWLTKGIQPAAPPAWLVDWCRPLPPPPPPPPPEDYAGTDRGAETLLRMALDGIHGAGQGDRHEACYRAARTAGRLVAAGRLEQGRAVAEVMAAAEGAYGGRLRRRTRANVENGIRAGLAAGPLRERER